MIGTMTFSFKIPNTESKYGVILKFVKEPGPDYDSEYIEPQHDPIREPKPETESHFL